MARATPLICVCFAIKVGSIFSFGGLQNSENASSSGTGSWCPEKTGRQKSHANVGWCFTQKPGSYWWKRRSERILFLFSDRTRLSKYEKRERGERGLSSKTSIAMHTMLHTVHLRNNYFWTYWLGGWFLSQHGDELPAAGQALGELYQLGRRCVV